MAPFMDRVQLPEGCSNFEEAVYFLPFSSQTFLVLILLTSERLKAESTLEPLNGFEHGTPGLEIQHLNHFPCIILIHPMEVYPPSNLRKKFVPTKFLANFQIKFRHYNEGTRGRGQKP